MGAKVTHVEVTGKDGAALQQFYKDVFGWSLDTNNPGGYGMYRQEDGLTGGIGASQDGGAGQVTFYVHTDDPQPGRGQAARDMLTAGTETHDYDVTLDRIAHARIQPASAATCHRPWAGRGTAC